MILCYAGFMNDTSAIQIGLQGFTVAVVVLFLVDRLWWILAGSKDDGVRGRVAWSLASLQARNGDSMFLFFFLLPQPAAVV